MFRSTAHLYDLVYELAGKDYASEAAVLAAQIRQHHPIARTLLDVACGTGGHLVRLTHLFDVVGLDVDAGMLAEARRKLPDTELVEGDMRDFDLGRTYDAVVCLFSSIGYLRDGDELDAAIATMARHLAPGGVLVVDGWVRPEDWREPGSVHAISGARDGQAVARVGRSFREGRRTVLELHHLAATLDGVEHLVDRHEMTLFTDDEYRSAFDRAGLTVDVVPSPYPDRDRYIGIRPATKSER